MIPGCVHKSWCGLEVSSCCECPYGEDYAACVDFRRTHDGVKIQLEEPKWEKEF